METQIILASGSPRRQRLLLQVGIPHTVLVSNADETVTGEPQEQVQELALRKAKATYDIAEEKDSLIIAADTLVYLNGEVLGKPQDKTQAVEMLSALQGQTHQVYTGVAMLKGDTQHVFYDMAEVTFHPLTPEEILAYVKTGEPFDKAGAYGIQEKGAALVERINGDFYTVMGLPISKVCRALKKFSNSSSSRA